MSTNLEVKAVDPDLFEAIDPTVYFDPDLFDLGPLANPYLEDSEEEQLFIEAFKTTESQEQLFVEASKTAESQEQQEPEIWTASWTRIFEIPERSCCSSEYPQPDQVGCSALERLGY